MSTKDNGNDDVTGGQDDAEKADKKASKKAKKLARKAAKKAEKKAEKKEAKAAKKAKRESWADGASSVAYVDVDAVDDDMVPILTKLDRKDYEKRLAKLQIELVKLQEWIRVQNLKVVVIFEGRDAAGKGGVIKRITQSLNPRICRVVALPMPTEREATQWYFQRYVPHLPAAGEMVLFDRSWYNRAGVERVMGYCSEEQHQEFLRTCPEFERMIVRSGIQLIKYWFSVSDEVQERRFQERIETPTKRWKLSDIDLMSRERWVDYSRAKDVMFKHTDIKQAPWYVVHGDVKKRARINCITHLLSLIPYEDLTPAPVELPPRQPNAGYVRPPMSDQTFVPEVLD